MSTPRGEAPQPRIVVFTTVFPHAGQPAAGLFIRERMFRVGQRAPLVVVAPLPWFPLQGLLRYWRPHFRPRGPRYEEQQGVAVYHPRFFSIPALGKSWDGFFLALGSYFTFRRLRRQFRFNLIDAHFAYPDGYAATWLGRWFATPVTITLRGTEVPIAATRRRRLLTRALHRAVRIFAVAEALKQHACRLGIAADKIRVVGNGVDLEKFYPLDQAAARQELGSPPRGLTADGPVLISVGGLVERKGFHRVIACLPAIRQVYPNVRYLIVGGPSAEGDITAELRQQITALGLEDHVHMLGRLPPERLKYPLSAADVFVLATRNEGWANVFLEAMACGLPVVTTRVGGNAEVVSRPELGILTPFGDQTALTQALLDALERSRAADCWDRAAIIDYARQHTWDRRVDVLIDEFERIVQQK